MGNGQQRRDTIRRRLERLYGEATGLCMDRMELLVGRYGLGRDLVSAPERWSQRDAVLITYGDMVRLQGENPLATLERFLSRRLQGAINTVHILPFFPYSSDDGFSVIDYRQVDPALGTWDDVRAIGRNFRLAFDLVLNHVSRRSEWFHDYTGGILPARDYFIEVPPDADLSAVVRPRPQPCVTSTTTRDGTRQVWATFSEDQIDLNFANPDVLFEFLDILLFYVTQGMRIVRLDAIAYLWKKPGTSCIHLPETHEVVKLIRDVMALLAPHVLILTETNVPHRENVSYFGDGDEAHMVYQFSLPPLLFHALETGSARALTQWAASLGDPPPGCTFLNFTASHDGIGVRPLEGLVPVEELRELLESTRRRGGRASTARNADGVEIPYELNITYFDAMGGPGYPDDPLHVARFLCSQTIAMGLRGIPAVYFHSLTATPNDVDGMKQTGRARSINRRKWDAQELKALLDAPDTATARVCREYVRLLRLRAEHPAFHPDGVQRVLSLGDGLFGLTRTAPDGQETLTAVSNVTARDLTAPLPAGHDLIGDRDVNGDTELKAYETVWVRHS